MNSSKYIFLSFFLLVAFCVKSQNIHYFFVDDIYQRSYFNPALNNKGKISLSSGLGLDINTNGPSINDFIVKKADGKLLLSASNAISEMNQTNDIYGYSCVNTFDASIKLPFLLRVSVGHAWKSNGWLQYSKDLAEFVTFGNGGFVGETLNLGPQVNYLNYNEIYLGLQKDFGMLSVGVKIKRLSGVETIFTNPDRNKIDLTTSDDIYQLTLDTDFEINSSQALTYTDINDFGIDIDNFSFENILSNNGGWAFDIGASTSIGDRLELSLSILDIGSINWDQDLKSYSTNKTQTFEGIDVAEYITSDSEFIITDSIEALLQIDETNTSFSTQLPTQIYLGANLKISDLWTVGAIVQSIGSGDRRSNVLGLNARTKIYDWLSAGVLYSAKSGNIANLGLSGSIKLGPVSGFLSTDNILRIGSTKSKNSTIRAGLSVRI